MSQSKDVVDSAIATNDTSSAVVSTKAGEIVAEATPCLTSQESSVHNRENERGDSLVSGDGDARAPPSSSQNLAEGSSQPNKANSPVDGVTTSVTGTIQWWYYFFHEFRRCINLTKWLFFREFCLGDI